MSADPLVLTMTVTPTEQKWLMRIRSLTNEVVQIDPRTGALIVIGRSENCAANNNGPIVLPIDKRT